MNSRYLILVLIVLSPISSFGISWQDSLIYDQEALQKTNLDWNRKAHYLKDPAFNYVKSESQSNPLEEMSEFIADLWKSFWDWLLPEPGSSSRNFWLIDLLPRLSLFVLFILSLWLLVKGALNWLPQKQIVIKNGSGILHPELHGPEPLEQLLHEAVTEKKFALAIRYRYLLLLQNLASTGRIKWHEPKTNTDYWSEIRDPGLKNAFQRASFIYECTWYGEYSVDESGFIELSKAFDRVKALL